jgi:hypothetical protein
MHLHVLEATAHGGGLTIRIGPVDIGEAIILIDRHLAPNGWAPRLLPLVPVGQAINHFDAARNPQPVEEADLFVALRRAIITDPDNDGADCPRAAALIAHAEAHRPLQLWCGDEECLLSECDHDREDGGCPGIQPSERLCVTCSAVYDSGSEWGPEWLDACRVPWPCPPIRAVAAHYNVPLGDDREAAERG